MEYSKFIRLYYSLMVEIFKDEEFKPTIHADYFDGETIKCVPYEYSDFNKDNGFLGYGITSDAPDSVYEDYFQDRLHLYPEFWMLFIGRENLLKASKTLNTSEAIREYLEVLLTAYKEVNLIF